MSEVGKPGAGSTGRQGNGKRKWVEERFVAWGHFSYQNRWWMLFGVLLFSGFLIAQLPNLTADNSTDSFLHKSDPIRIVYDDFRKIFGRDEQILLAIEGEAIFEREFVERLRALHEEIEEEVPHVDEILSLINARSTRGEADRLIVEDLFEEWPETDEALAAIREHALSNPVFENFLYSGDERVTLLTIRLVAYATDDADDADALAGFDASDEMVGEAEASGDVVYLSQEDAADAVAVTREIMERHRAPGFEIHLAGGPVITETMNVWMKRDSALCLLLSLVTITLLLFVFFRSIAAVVLPLIIVVLSMLCTLGTMALTGFPMSIGTQILPSFLVAVGVCDAVHLITIYYQQLEAGEGKEDAIAFTLGHSGLAVLMTSITTAGGLASFIAGDLQPIAQLGIWAPVGVLLAFVFTMALLPPLVGILPVKSPVRGERKASEALDRSLVGMGDFAAHRPWSVVVGSMVVLLAAATGIVQLSFSHDPISNWMPDGNGLREGTLFMNDRMGGAMVLEMLIDSGRENGLHDPEVLNRIQDLQAWANELERGDWHVVKTVSINDIVKETHQALNENRPEFYVLPQDRTLLAQELLLFENAGSDDLTDFVDSEFRRARVTVRVPWMDAMNYPPIIKELQATVPQILGDDVTFELTGLLPLLARTFSATLTSMARSYVIALIIITPLMIMLIGDLFRGVLSMVPNLTPVIVMLGIMGSWGIPLDGSNLMVGAIVIGLSVDDTIHFMHNFRRYYEQTGDATVAIRNTLQTTGKALLLTSLILSAGFYASFAAYMENMKLFGFLAGTGILVAFFANVMLSSALMVLATRREQRREQRRIQGFKKR